MAGPPTDITASELVRRLSETPRPSEVVDFPRVDAEGKPLARVRIQVLHEHERQKALKRAWDWCKSTQHLTPAEMNADVVREGMYGSAVAREILALCCVSELPIEGSEKMGAPQYARQFATGDEVDKHLTQDEMAALFTAYTIVTRRFGPISSEIETDEELNAWIKRIVEGASAAPLALQDSSQLVDLIVMLTARVLVAIVAAPSTAFPLVFNSVSLSKV
jgi:hypothetical protein